MSWEPELPLNVPAITICESAFSNVPAHPTQHKRSVDSCNRNEERFSKTSSAGGIPESRERDPESQHQFSIVQERVKNFESPALTHEPMKAPKTESGVDSHKSVQERFSKQSKGNADPVILERAFNNAPEQPTQHKSRGDSCNRNEERFSKTSNGEGIPESRERDPESQHQFSIVQERRKNFESPALIHEPMKAPKTESGVDSHKSVQERFSKQSKGNADPVILERGNWSCEKTCAHHDGPSSQALNNAPEQPTQHKSRGDSCNRNEERFSKTSNGEGIQESQERDPESQHQFSIVQERRKNFESPGRTEETNTSWGQESMREEMEKILSEKLAVLQRQLEMTQQAIPPMKEMTNTWASLQKLPENKQALQKGLENLQVSTKEDTQMLRADLEERVSKSWNVPERSESKENLVEVENQAGRTVETNTSWGQESMREEMEKILSEKLAVLQRQLEMTQQVIPPMKEMTNTWTSLQKISESMQALQKGLENLQVSTKEDLQMLRADLEGRVPKAWNVPERSESKESLVEVENQAGFFKMQRYKVDVTLNADTAHPRLEVSEDGKSVTDTGVIRQVPSKEERFDSHTFVLAKEGYTSGRQYWEVDVGRRRNWILGVASESVARKGTMTLSPKNGFWVIGLADGEEYWAHTDPWTRLTVSGKPEKIGIFLNISANKLSFYNAKKKTVLYTFTSIDGIRLERKFVPFFSTGSVVSVHDTEPLKIVQEFDDD